MSAFGFNADDTEALIQPIYDRDSGAVADWMCQHVLTHRDMHAFMGFLCRMISLTYPMALTKSVTLEPGEFWGLSTGPASTPNDIDAARMLTASLNEDWDTVTALINATLSKDELAHAEVAIHLIKAWGDGLRAVADANKRQTTNHEIERRDHA